MKTPQEWDEMLTLSPMNAQEALRSVRIKPEEIEAIQTDARSDLLDRIKVLEGEVASLRMAYVQNHAALEWCHRRLDDADLPIPIWVVVAAESTSSTVDYIALLRRIPLGLIRVEEHRQLYLDMCAALGEEPLTF